MEFVGELRKERTEDRAIGNYSPVKTKQRKEAERAEKWSEVEDLMLSIK